MRTSAGTHTKVAQACILNHITVTYLELSVVSWNPNHLPTPTYTVLNNAGWNLCMTGANPGNLFQGEWWAQHSAHSACSAPEPGSVEDWVKKWWLLKPTPNHSRHLCSHTHSALLLIISVNNQYLSWITGDIVGKERPDHEPSLFPSDSGKHVGDQFSGEGRHICISVFLYFYLPTNLPTLS